MVDTQPARGNSVFLIEAQALFVPTLTDVFIETGLGMVGVTSDVDLRELFDERPDVLFVDTDYIRDDPLQTIALLSLLMPGAIICVYTNERSRQWAHSCHTAGAMAVFSKNAPRDEIVDGIRAAMRREPYTDARLR